MTPEQIEIERKAFEEVMRRDTFDSLERVSDGTYRSYEARVGWIMWLARAEKAERVREALAELMRLQDQYRPDPAAHEWDKAWEDARAALKEDTHG